MALEEEAFFCGIASKSPLQWVLISRIVVVKKTVTEPQSQVITLKSKSSMMVFYKFHPHG